MAKIYMSGVSGFAALLMCDFAHAGTDPVGVDPRTGANFNRYYYANNNPYKFVDPDGRAARIVHENGQIRVEMPASFMGPGAIHPHVSHVRSGFEGQSGVYNVNGRPTQVDFRITEITPATPAGLRNQIKMFLGPTDHPAGTGVNYANKVGGTRISLDVTSKAFKYGAAPHELNHLGGAIDAYRRNAEGVKIADPLRQGDIMNQLPGSMTDTVIKEMLDHPNNQHVER